MVTKKEETQVCFMAEDKEVVTCFRKVRDGVACKICGKVFDKAFYDSVLEKRVVEKEFKMLTHDIKHRTEVTSALWDALSTILEEPSTQISDALRRQGLEAIEVAQRGGRG